MILLFGSSYNLHFAHHVVAWIFSFCILVHVYAVFCHDIYVNT